MNLFRRTKKNVVKPSELRSFGKVPRLSTTTAELPPWVSFEEPVEGYGPDGYYPVTVGDFLSPQYRVVKKLGWGQYSTVWMVHGNDGCAAAKVMDAKSTDAPELHELEYLIQLRDGDQNHSGYNHVVRLLDHFYVRAPGSRHSCLITELCGESLFSFAGRFEKRVPPRNAVKKAIKHSLLGLDYLHTVCNIIHTDVKLDNLVFATTNEETSTVPNSSTECVSRPGIHGSLVNITKSNPIRSTLPTDLNSPRSMENVQVKLVDLGVACYADKTKEHFTDLIQPPGIRAPEVCIGAGWGKPADIWSMGCLAYELWFGQAIISNLAQPESIVNLQTLAVGPFPLSVIKRGRYSDLFFTRDGQLNVPNPQYPVLKERFQQRVAAGTLDEEFADFLLSMLCIEPVQRLTTTQLLQHAWLTS